MEQGPGEPGRDDRGRERGQEPTAPYPHPYPGPYDAPTQAGYPPPAGSYAPPPAYGPPAPGYGPPPVPYGYGYPPPPNDGLGIAALVVGIAAFVLACLYGVGLLASPVALVMGRVSMRRIDRSNGTLGGRGQAQAGFVLGIVGTVLLVLLLAVVAVIVIAVVHSDGGGTTGSGNV